MLFLYFGLVFMLQHVQMRPLQQFHAVLGLKFLEFDHFGHGSPKKVAAG